MNEPTEIWVPWKYVPGLDGTTPITYKHPDIPEGIEFTSDELGAACLSNPDEPFTEYAYVIVAKADMEKCAKAVPESAVSERDKLFVKMARRYRRNAFFVPLGAEVPSEARNNAWPHCAVTGGEVHYRPPTAEDLDNHTPEEIAEADAAGKLNELVNDPEARMDSFFDAIPDLASANAERKQMVKDVLVQAVARGLSAAKAEAIRIKHGLPVSGEA